MIDKDEFVTELNRRIFSSIASKILSGSDFSTFSLGSEFSADEMGKISKIITEGRKMAVDNATAMDYINVIKNTHINDENMDVSNDEELLRYMNSLNKGY